MRPLDAYRQQQQSVMPRIDLILALFRKGRELIARAGAAVRDGRRDEDRRLRAQAQLIVGSLASGQAGTADALAGQFLRLYEFVGHCLASGGLADLESADKILATLQEGFAQVREQAVQMESQGAIPPLEREHLVQVSV